jgi:DNA repair photolyase
MTQLTEVQARSILRKQKRVDAWFLSSYGMNLYRGCAHDCAYCDGRAERYQVEGDFGQQVAVKTNAPELLARELDPRRRRKPFAPGYVFLGGGVSDAYQPAEASHGLTRRALELLAGSEHPFGVHVLTKSTLVRRDTDLLARIKERSGVIVSFSLSTVDDAVSATFEPGAAPPSERLEALRAFKAQGLACGVYLLPVIPGVTDSRQAIEQSVDAAVAAGADFICFGGMTLKGGRQQQHFNAVLERHAPGLAAACEALYSGDRWGSASAEYYAALNRRFHRASRGRIPRRIPPALWPQGLDDQQRAVLMLEQIDHLVTLAGQRRSPYGRVARTVADLPGPLLLQSGLLQSGLLQEAMLRLVREILESGRCDLYDRLI